LNAWETKTALGTISLDRSNSREELIFKHRNFITKCVSLLFAIPKDIGT
jgi:hypothetical protein